MMKTIESNQKVLNEISDMVKKGNRIKYADVDLACRIYKASTTAITVLTRLGYLEKVERGVHRQIKPFTSETAKQMYEYSYELTKKYHQNRKKKKPETLNMPIINIESPDMTLEKAVRICKENGYKVLAPKFVEV